MITKNITKTLLAVCLLCCGAAAALTSCSTNEEARYLSNIRLSTSFVSLSKDGGSTQVKLTATSDWQVSETPEWLTVSPMNGAAGQDQTLTFSAEPASGRTATLTITCGGQTQEINVIQGLAEVQAATCAEVIAGADAKTYLVTGVCTKISNTQYGNWYIDDGTGEVYIYGTVDASGKYNWASFGIEVGDEVTVQGPKTTYNGTPELVDVSVVKVNKSLIKVDSLSATEIPLEGGDLIAFVSCKGDGINVQIPDDAKDWLFISAITSSSVTFHALENTGGDRSTTVTLKTYNGKKEYTSQMTITQKGAIVAATVAEFLEAAVGDTQFRMTGIISELYYYKENVSGFYIRDYSGETLVYKPEGFTGTEAKVGDIVTVVGKRGEYKENPQMVSGLFEELNYPVTEISIAEFLTKDDDKGVYYMITGTVDEIANETYGNLYLTDGNERLYVYGCYPGYGATGDNRKGFLADADIAVGDRLTMIGYKDTYNGTIELCGGIYFAHDKP